MVFSIMISLGYSQNPLLIGNTILNNKEFRLSEYIKKEGKKYNRNADLSSVIQNALNDSKYKTIVIDNQRYYIKNNINIPFGKVLKFENGGMISAVKGQKPVIKGNNTVIDANIFQQVFGINISLTGTFNVDKFSVCWYGAKGDGTTDNTKAINKTFSVKGVDYYIPKGDFYVSKTVWLSHSDYNKFTMDGSLYSDNNIIILKIKNPKKSIQKKEFKLNSGFTRYKNNSNRIAIELGSAFDCIFTITRANNGYYGLHINPKEGWKGFSNNYLNIKILNNNKYNLVLHSGADAKEGWINQNTFIGGDLFTSSSFPKNEYTYGIYFKGKYHSNNNIFINTCIQLGQSKKTNGAQGIPFLMEGGRNNLFLGYRTENCSDTAVKLVDVDIVSNNYFKPLYNESKIIYTNKAYTDPLYSNGIIDWKLAYDFGDISKKVVLSASSNKIVTTGLDQLAYNQNIDKITDVAWGNTNTIKYSRNGVNISSTSAIGFLIDCHGVEYFKVELSYDSIYKDGFVDGNQICFNENMKTLYLNGLLTNDQFAYKKIQHTYYDKSYDYKTSHFTTNGKIRTYKFKIMSDKVKYIEYLIKNTKSYINGIKVYTYPNKAKISLLNGNDINAPFPRSYKEPYDGGQWDLGDKVYNIDETDTVMYWLYRNKKWHKVYKPY